MDTPRSHLRREARTALELAIVALAPTEIIDALAVSAGLLEALSELPTDNAPVSAMAEATAERAKAALDSWRQWEKKHAGQA